MLAALAPRCEALGLLRIYLRFGSQTLEGRIATSGENRLALLRERLPETTFSYRNAPLEHAPEGFTTGFETTFAYHDDATFHVGRVRMLYAGRDGVSWTLHPDDATAIIDEYASIVEKRQWWQDNGPTVMLIILYSLPLALLLGVVLFIVRRRRKRAKIGQAVQ